MEYAAPSCGERQTVVAPVAAQEARVGERRADLAHDQPLVDRGHAAHDRLPHGLRALLLARVRVRVRVGVGVGVRAGLSSRGGTAVLSAAVGSMALWQVARRYSSEHRGGGLGARAAHVRAACACA